MAFYIKIGRIEPAADDRHRPSNSRRTLIATTTVLALAGLTVGAAAAAPQVATVTTTNVRFVTLSPAYTLFSSKALAAHTAFSAVVIGGSTRVPTNATTVKLHVTASGSAAGSMSFYPAGNSAGGSGQKLSWTAGHSASAYIEENVGTSDELTFSNGVAASKATATIVGYSTQVTDGDLSAADGTKGQVLTNTGTGVTWQTQNFQSALTATMVIHPTTDQVANGAALRAALTSGHPLVVAEPGVYDLGSTPLTLGNGVSLMGGGTTETEIVTSSSITMAGANEVSDTHILLTGTGSIVAPTGSTPTLRDDYVLADDSSTSDSIAALVQTGTGYFTVVDSTIHAQGEGPFAQGLVENGSVTSSVIDSDVSVSTTSSTTQAFAVNAFGFVSLQGSTVVANGPGSAVIALLAQGAPSEITLDSSKAYSDSFVLDASGEILVGASRLAGTVTTSGTGALTCVASYNQSYVPLGSACT